MWWPRRNGTDAAAAGKGVGGAMTSTIKES